METALINQRDLTDALLDTERSLRELAQSSGGAGHLGGTGHNRHRVRHPPNQPPSPTGGTLPQASPVSVYLFPGERGGAQPPLPPVGVLAGSLGSCSEAEEGEKENEGDGDTLDSDEFCILDAPGLGIPVRGGHAGQGRTWERVAQLRVLLEMELWERQEAGRVFLGRQP